MKAAGYFKPGPVDELMEVELEAPALRPRDLLVRVEAISVNPADVEVWTSATPAEGSPRILGYDAVGVVEAVGAEAKLFLSSDHSRGGLHRFGGKR